jgi:bifunctional non-homologous end joining protein LigD
MPAAEQLARGEIKIILQGRKLRGGFVLVHMGRAKARPREKSRWLLIKRKDEYAKRSWNPEQPELSRSVITGRKLEEIQSGRRERKRAA